jgi:hypothetical protein
MSKITMYLALVLFLFVGGVNLRAAQPDMGTAEFLQLYQSLLQGKSIVNETIQDEFSVRTESYFGEPIDLADNDYEIPVTKVITKSKDGNMVQRITVNILDRVHDIGDSAIIYEEAKSMMVENPEAAPRDTKESEFLGLFRVAKNDKGGFEVSNFGLLPSVAVEDGKNKLAASNISYSCYSENNKSKCVLTVRDYKLGDYNQLQGYTLGEPVGTDYVVVAEEEVAQ